MGTVSAPAASRWPAGPTERRAVVRRYYTQFGIVLAVLLVLLVAAVVFALTYHSGAQPTSPAIWLLPGAVAVLLVLPTLMAWGRVKARALSVPELEATDDELRISRIDGLRSSAPREQLDHVMWLLVPTGGPGLGHLLLRDRSDQLLANWVLPEEIGRKVVGWLGALGYRAEPSPGRAESSRLRREWCGAWADFSTPVRARHGKVVPLDRDASHSPRPRGPFAAGQAVRTGSAGAGQGPAPLLEGWEGATGLVFFYFVAPSPEAAADVVLAPGGPAARSGTAAVKDVEPVVQLGKLEEILTGVPYEQIVDGAGGRPAPAPERTGGWTVLGTSPELARRLSRLGPAQRRAAAEKWSGTQEMRGVGPDRSAEVVDALCSLSRLADRSGQLVYAAASPLAAGPSAATA